MFLACLTADYSKVVIRDAVLSGSYWIFISSLNKTASINILVNIRHESKYLGGEIQFISS